MDPRQFGTFGLKWKQSKTNLIPDPGNGQTIRPLVDRGTCNLTVAASVAETRLLPPVASVPDDHIIKVVANVVGANGTVTISGVTLSNAGDWVFFAITSISGTKTWVATSASDLVSASDLFLNSTNEMNIGFGGVSGLAIDDAAITGNAAAADVNGKSLFVGTQDGGSDTTDISAGHAGGNLTITLGAGIAADTGSSADGGPSGCLSIVAQAGGAGDGAGVAGAAGVFRVITAAGPGGFITKQAAPATATTARSLTAAELLGGLIIGTPTATGGTIAYTLPTGALMDAALHSQVGADEAFNWSMQNLAAAAADTITLTASSGHTVSPTSIVLPSSHSTTVADCVQRYRTRRTAADTFVTYRI